MDFEQEMIGRIAKSGQLARARIGVAVKPSLSPGPSDPGDEQQILRPGRPNRCHSAIEDRAPVSRRQIMRLVHQPERDLGRRAVMVGKLAPHVGKPPSGYR